MRDNDFAVDAIQPLECYKEGWEAIKSDYWLFFAITLVAILIGAFTLYVLLGAMFCGLIHCYLKKIDTGQASIDDLWHGFKFFGPSLLVMLVIIVPMIVVYGLIYVPLIVGAMSGMSEDEMIRLLIGALAVDFVLIIVMVCFHTLLMFSFPLLVDRGLTAVGSMKLSARAIWHNLRGVGGLIGIQFVLGLLGMLTCGLGAYFLAPIMLAGVIVGYRKVFPALDAKLQTPPPPNGFSSAGEQI